MVIDTSFLAHKSGQVWPGLRLGQAPAVLGVGFRLFRVRRQPGVHRLLGLGLAALIHQQAGQRDMTLGVVWLLVQARAIAFFRLLEVSLALIALPGVVDQARFAGL